MFFLSEAFGIVVGLLALRFRRAYMPMIRSRFGWHLHCIGLEFSRHLSIIRGIAILGLGFGAQCLREYSHR
jgi:hypothetical protein